MTETATALPIYEFRGEYRFLSNFFGCEVESPEDHMIYPTVEHAFQAAKSEDVRERMLIRRLPTAGDAKRAGRKLTLREDWEDVKKLIMFRLVLSKFTMTEILGARLIETGSRTLIEGNSWGDHYWGAVPASHAVIIKDGGPAPLPLWVKDGHPDTWLQGRNYLGQILMAVRMVIE